MKKFYLALIVLCASLMASCGNSEIDKINQLIEDATEQTAAATSAQEIVEIAQNLDVEMAKITEASGDQLTIGKNADAALAKYQEVVTAKLAEFGMGIEF